MSRKNQAGQPQYERVTEVADGVDPHDAVNKGQLDAATEGLGEGGGSAPDDWISVYIFNGSQLVKNANTFAVFDTGNDPAPRGTALTWDAEAPTVVNVNADGIYDISGKLLVKRASGATPGTITLAEVLLNGDNSGPGYTYDLVDIPIPAPISGAGLYPLLFFIPGVAQTEGQTIRLLLKAGTDDTIVIQEAALTVSRRG